MYIEFNTGNTDMVGKYEIVYIGVQGGLTNGADKVKWTKIIRNFQTKKRQNTAVHTST